jgi:hypothetical protein
MESEGEKER